MALIDEMRARLQAALDPTVLEITDESEGHRGHAGYREGGESHWHVRIASAGFAGQSRLARHRAVHAALGADIIGRIHALRLTLEES